MVCIKFPILGRSLEVNKDLFHHEEDNEDLLGPKVPYLNANWCSTVTQRHWNEINIYCVIFLEPQI